MIGWLGWGACRNISSSSSVSGGGGLGGANSPSGRGGLGGALSIKKSFLLVRHHRGKKCP